MKTIIISLIILLTSCVTTNHTFYYNTEINIIENKTMLFIQITLNNKKAYLLIDTGASKSLLDITQAEKYNFKYNLLVKDKYIGIGGKQDIFTIYNYKINELFIPFFGADISNINEYFIKDNIPIIGILGCDFLEKYKTKIDFETNKLYYTKTILEK